MKSLHVIADVLETLTLPQEETTQFIDFILINTEVTAIDLSPFVELETAEIKANKITDMDFSGNPNLVSLDCTENPLTGLNLANGMNDMLETLDVRSSVGDLQCIQIDPGFTPPTDGSWQKNEGTEYSEDCN